MNTTVITETMSLSSERFGFTMFVSICLHVAFILGVGFNILEQANSSTSLEITFAQYRSQAAPKDADFLAQENQQGSGSQDETATTSTPVQSRFSDNVIQEVSPFVEKTLEQPLIQDQVINTAAESQDIARQDIVKDKPMEVPDQPLENLSNSEFNNRLASLQAQLEIRRQEYAKRPRRYTISSASTQKARDILYLNSWRKKVEAIGNLNYPAQASAQGIYGNLRLLVSLRSDGSVSEVQVLSSSGYHILDESAIRIVHMGAPYDPFPPEMNKEVDILDIIRTWQFQRNNQFSTF
jgi:protein TonB